MPANETAKDLLGASCVRAESAFLLGLVEELNCAELSLFHVSMYFRSNHVWRNKCSDMVQQS